MSLTLISGLLYICRMKKKFIYILSGLLFLTGCITNDIPYPVVVPHVDSFDVEGASKVEIDSDKQVITVYFASSGERLWDIARSHNTSCELIRTLNSLNEDILDKDCMLVLEQE